MPACVGSSAEHKMEIDALNPASTVSNQHEHQHKARRLRGGGAGRVSRVSFRLHPCIAPGYRIDAPRRASISLRRLSHHFTVSPLALDVDPLFPIGRQNCFIGLIECFICFGTYCFLPFRNQMVSSSFPQNAARFVSHDLFDSPHPRGRDPLPNSIIFSISPFDSDLVTGKHVLIPPSGMLRVLRRHHL